MRGIFSTWSSEPSLLFLCEAVCSCDFLVYVFLTSDRFKHILICFGHWACSQSCLDLFPIFLKLFFFLMVPLPLFFYFLFFWGQGLLVQTDLENFALTPQMLQIQVLPLCWTWWNTGDEIQGFIHARQTLNQPISETLPSDYLFACLSVSCSPDSHQTRCFHSFSLPVC